MPSRLKFTHRKKRVNSSTVRTNKKEQQRVYERNRKQKKLKLKVEAVKKKIKLKFRLKKKKRDDTQKTDENVNVNLGTHLLLNMRRNIDIWTS